MPKFKSPNGDPIIAILETTPCIVGIDDISEDGSSVQYDGVGSDMLWDDQAPIRRNGSLVFLCEDGNEWTFQDLVRADDA